MDPLMNRLAREMTDAIAAAVAKDPAIEACREKARAAGLDLHVSLETVIGFGDRDKTASAAAGNRSRQTPRTSFEMSANDRRFLKSLRISSDEATGKEVE